MVSSDVPASRESDNVSMWCLSKVAASDRPSEIAQPSLQPKERLVLAGVRLLHEHGSGFHFRLQAPVYRSGCLDAASVTSGSFHLKKSRKNSVLRTRALRCHTNLTLSFHSLAKG